MKTKNITTISSNLKLICLMIVGFSTFVFPQDKNHVDKSINQEETKKFLCVEIYGEKGSNVKVRLNDIPVCELLIKNEDGSGNAFTFANFYAIPDINTLSVYPLSKKGSATIRLARYKKGDITGENNGETLVKIEIENDDTPVHKKIKLSPNRQKWSWMETDLITNESSKKEAIAFAKSFYKTMQQSNVEEMAAAADPIIGYEALSKPETSKQELINQWTEGLKMVFTDQNTFDDINSISIKLTPIANGKLFRVTRADDSPLFCTSNENESNIGFKDIIGRKNGVWKFYH
ncbi:hypothetical protein [Aquimarina litoralis]|uniref:hypothetical protein n=1 Tax=Aquimarina litoralis TaxID=584605 RepID=UPI001C59EFFA|nr:hypothetical protein [Aquimarina litoralis]MBW1295032.1 hypothetical protein [Aquimarina litoralis]